MQQTGGCLSIGKAYPPQHVIVTAQRAKENIQNRVNREFLGFKDRLESPQEFTGWIHMLRIISCCLYQLFIHEPGSKKRFWNVLR